MEELIVEKSGGDTLRFPKDIKRLEQRVTTDKRRRVISVSAPGKTDESPKVTDILINLAKTDDHALLDQAVFRMRELCPDARESELKDSLFDLTKERDTLPPDSYEDSLNAWGEDTTAQLIADATGFEYVSTRDLFRVTSNPRNGRILPVSRRMIRRRLSNPSTTYVFGGAQGYTEDGLVVTLGRNSSDESGAYAAASLKAIVYEIFKKLRGINSAQPDFFPKNRPPKVIDRLTFEELGALSYLGFNVVHPRAIIPVEEARVPIHVRSYRDYPREGTYVVADRESDPRMPIVGVAYKEGFCVIKIRKTGLNGEMGIGVRILNVLKRAGISWEFMPGSVDDLSVVFSQHYLGQNISLDDLVRKVKRAAGSRARVEPIENAGGFIVAGVGLKRDFRHYEPIQSTLRDIGVERIFTSEGAAISAAYGIHPEDARKTISAIYERYIA